MKLHQSLKATILRLLTIVVCSIYSSAFAQENQNTETTNEPQLVEVELSQDTLAPYSERRARHGAYIGIDYEQLVLKNYLSTLEDRDYESLFGSDSIPLLRLNIDYKYNTDIAAIAVGIDFGKGSISDDGGVAGQDRTLDVTKYGIGAKLVLDMLFSEPYVAPYVGINVWQMSLAEKNPTDSFSATTQMGFNYTIGLMLQLDWLDFDSGNTATFNWGLENTFLDVYGTQYTQTSSAEDPNTETNFLLGGGLRLEF